MSRNQFGWDLKLMDCIRFAVGIVSWSGLVAECKTVVGVQDVKAVCEVVESCNLAMLRG